MLRKIIGIVCAVVMIVTALTACTTSAPSATVAASTAPTEAPTVAATATPAPTPSAPPEDTREIVPITIMTLHSNYSDVDGIASDPIKAYIEKKLKVKLSFIGGDNQQARLMVTTGRAPDILSCFSWEDGFTALMNDGIAQGMYIDMNYYTAKEANRYPVLNKIFADKNFQAFNQMYGGDKNKCFVFFTMLQALRTMSTPIFNMKYLSAAGITTLPTTVDELVADLRAIHAAEPNIITMGFLNYKGTSFPGELDDLFFETNGTNANKIIEDASNPGTFTDSTLNDKNKEVWKLLAQLNKEGIFDKEAFSKDAYYLGTDDFATGKTAVITFACPNTDWSMYDWLWSCIFKNDPSATPEQYPMLDQPLKGEYMINPGVSLSCGVVIPTTSMYPDRALDVLEYSLSNEGQEITNAGLPGIDHTKDASGNIVMTDDQVTNWNKNAAIYKQSPGYWGVFTMMVYNGGTYVDYEHNDMVDAYLKSQLLVQTRNMKGKIDAPYADKVVKTYQSLAKYTGDLSLDLYKLDDKGLAVQKKLSDVTTKWFTKFFNGDVDVDTGWDQFKKEYTDAGAADYLAAYTKAITDARALLK